MKRKFNKLPFRWILRLALIAFASYVTGLSFWWCLLVYIGIMFLIEFAKKYDCYNPWNCDGYWCILGYIFGIVEPLKYIRLTE